MQLSRKGVRFITGWEGFSSCPYRDAVGVWTIGYGSTAGVGPSSPCVTKRRARRRLKREINATYAPAVTRLINRNLNQEQFDALCSFVYNVGVGALETSTLRKRLNSGENKRTVFREELPRWNRAGGAVLEGLTKRRWAEVRLANRGDYSGRP